MALFEIRQSMAGKTVSGTLPNAAYPRGKAMMISDVSDAGARTLVLAEGKCDGFLTRDVRTGTVPRTSDELLFPNSSLETPFLAQKEGTLEDADEFEAEGSDFLKTGAGTGQITGATAAGTKLSFESGVLYVAQEGDVAQYELIAQMTPEVDGGVRIWVKKIAGYVVPAAA